MHKNNETPDAHAEGSGGHTLDTPDSTDPSRATRDQAINRERALRLVADGYYVHPVGRDKLPYGRWTATSTDDPDQIRALWQQYPDALPALSPGRSGLTVVDLDQHPGKASGFEAAKANGWPINAEVQGTSISGLGRHLWYRGCADGDRDPAPGINLRTKGYVVVTYDLPPATSVIEPLPGPYQGYVDGEERNVREATPGTSSESHATADEVAAWMEKHTGVPDHYLLEYANDWPTEPAFRGNSRLLSRLKFLTLAGEEGRSGAANAIEDLHRNWSATQHGEGAYNAEKTFLRALARAVAVAREHQWPESVEVIAADGVDDPQKTTEPDLRAEFRTTDGLLDEIDEERVARELASLRVRHEARRRFDKSTREKVPLVTPIRLDHFLNEPDPEVIYRIGEMLPTGANGVLAAGYKAGKSTMLGNMVRSLADGDDFLGAFPVEPAGRTVLIDNELDPRTLRRWLRAQDIQHENRVEVIPIRGQVSSFNILDADVLAEWAEVIGPCDVLLLDCLRPVLDALGLDENREAGRFLVAFDELKAAVGASESLIVHHMGHNGERSRGDSRILDWPDVTWNLTRQDPSDPASQRYFSAYGRDVDVPEGQLGYNDDRRRLTYSEGGRGEVRHANAVDQATPLVLDFVKVNPGCSSNEIRDGVKHAAKAVREARENLLKDGKIHKTPRSGKGGGFAYYLSDAN